jgi:arginine repressor
MERVKPKTQGKIKLYLDHEGTKASKATISRDLREMGYEHIKGVGYFLKPEEKTNRNQQMLASTFQLYGKEVIADFDTIAIRTRPGFARSLSALAQEAYRESIFGGITGDDIAVIVVDRKQKQSIVDVAPRSWRPTPPFDPNEASVLSEATCCLCRF